MENKNCVVCGKPMLLVPAGYSKRTRQPYDAFWSCPDRCRQNLSNAKGQYASNYVPDVFKSPTTNSMPQDGIMLLADEIKAINANFDNLDKRFDNMSAYLAKEIEFIKTILNEMLGGEQKQ